MDHLLSASPEASRRLPASRFVNREVFVSCKVPGNGDILKPEQMMQLDALVTKVLARPRRLCSWDRRKSSLSKWARLQRGEYAC